MCGIAGYYGSQKIDRNRLEKCLQLMHKRGPDAHGIYQYQFNNLSNVYLLHTRLSIIDVEERSNQPFKVNSKAIIFNGELYNYIELKKILQKNTSFSTQSDTEVFLKIIDRYGLQALDQCEGMWAFALFDENNGSLILSRDRFGEKPLYVYRTSDGIYFGSEIKFISVLKGDSLEINYDHIFRYMINGYKSLYKKKHSFFKKVSEIPAATAICVNPDREEKQIIYWQPSFKQDDSLSYDDVVSLTKEFLINSVRLRLRSDVPLAFCLSGGIDSNSLISIAKKIFNYDVHGFTIINTDDRYSESELVEHSVSQLDIQYTGIPVTTNNFISNLEKLIVQHDSPVYTISNYANWLLMKNISDYGYKIAISGIGADELFSGYYDHYNFYMHDIRNDDALFEESLKNWQQYIQPIVRNPFLKDPLCFIKNPQLRDHIFLNSSIFSNLTKNKWYETFKENYFCNSLLRNRMLNELFCEAVPSALHEDDLNAMYYSIENRTPFLDRQLFELAIKIPTRFLIQNGMAKSVLRKSMTGIVPQKILNERRKVGFNAPFYSFFNIKDPDTRCWLFEKSYIYDFVEKKQIERLIQKGSLLNSESKFLFNFLNAKIFLEIFNG